MTLEHNYTQTSVIKEQRRELSGALGEEFANQRVELAEQLCEQAMVIGEGVHMIDTFYVADLIMGDCKETWFSPASHRGDVPYLVTVPAGSAIRVRALSRTEALETSYTLSEDPHLKLALIEADPRYCSLEYAPGLEQRLGDPLLPCEASARVGMELTWLNQQSAPQEMLLLALDITTACDYLEEGCEELTPPLYLEVSFFTPERGDRCEQDAPLIQLSESSAEGLEGLVSDLPPQSLESFTSRYPEHLWEQRLTPIGEREGDRLSCQHSSGRERVYRVAVPAGETIYAIQGPFDVLFAESMEACERACTSSVSRHYSNVTDAIQEVFVIVSERESEPLSEPFHLQLRSVVTRPGTLCSSPLPLSPNQHFGDVIEFQNPESDYPTTDNYQIGYLSSSQQQLGDRSVPLSSLSAERCALIDTRPEALNGPERIYELSVPPGEQLTVDVEVQDMSTEGELSWGPDFNLSLNLALEEGAVCERELSCVGHADASAHSLSATYFNPTDEEQSLLGVVESATTRQLLSQYSFNDHPFVSYYVRYTLHRPRPDERMSTAVSEFERQVRGYTSFRDQSLEGFVADYHRGRLCQPYASTGADRVYKLMIGGGSTVKVKATPDDRSESGPDLVLNVFDDQIERNESADRACLVQGVDQRGRGGQEELQFTNEELSTRVLYIVVAGYDEHSAHGSFDLEVEL